MLVTQFFRALNLFGAALLSGGLTWVLLVTIPAFRRMSQVESFRAHQTQLDDLPDRYMPAAWFAAVGGALVVALAGRDPSRPSELFYLLGVLALVPMVLITLFQNVPTNRLIRRLSVEAVPAEYPAIRRTWNRRHLIRTLCALAALLCFILANVVIAA
ncbi:MAG TPA: DUF1772 domain-containing protein [Thermomicrobiales bacterium]|nr:DUF1772 domain-containing protein [Thermomicrobiales bacterium]